MMKPEPAADQVEEQADVDHDLESGPPKTEEVLRLKKDASILFEHVTQQYKTFREKLYNEKLEEVSQELEMLQQPECLHPSYLRQMACVDQRLQKQQREARAFYRYKRQSLEDRTVAERAVIHSQFFQEIRDKREDVLSKLGEDWYAIQKERREAQQDIDDTKLYIYDPRRGTQLHQQAKYNHEVSILSGIAKHVGFPAALEITGVEGPALDDDMTAMKLNKGPPPPPRSAVNPTPGPTRATYPPPATLVHDERLAHERFIEQNPWARPQGSLHPPGTNTPNISHTADWAEQPKEALMRSLSAAGIGATRSLFATTPDATGAGASPLQVPKSRGPRPHAAVRAASADKEAAGLRNVSNISGTSTVDAAPDSDPPGPGSGLRAAGGTGTGPGATPQQGGQAAGHEYPRPHSVHATALPLSQQQRQPPQDSRFGDGFRGEDGDGAEEWTAGWKGRSGEEL